MFSFPASWSTSTCRGCTGFCTDLYTHLAPVHCHGPTEAAELLVNYNALERAPPLPGGDGGEGESLPEQRSQRRRVEDAPKGVPSEATERES